MPTRDCPDDTDGEEGIREIREIDGQTVRPGATWSLLQASKALERLFTSYCKAIAKLFTSYCKALERLFNEHLEAG